MQRSDIEMAMQAVKEDAKQSRAEGAALPYPILLELGRSRCAPHPHGEREPLEYRDLMAEKMQGPL